MRTISHRSIAIVLLSITAVAPLVGCSTAPPPVQVASATEVADMKTLRGIFDSVHGDYSKLTPDQKKQFLDYAKGDQSRVDRLWSVMTNPSGGGIPLSAENHGQGH